MKGKPTGAKPQSIIEYVLVLLLVTIVLAAALITLGESKEDYLPADNTPSIPESKNN